MALRINWSLLRSWIYRLGILLGLSIFIYQLWRGLQIFLHESNGINPIWLIGTLVVLCAVRGLQMIAWWFLMCGFGVRIKGRDLVENYTLSLLPRYIPGSIWGYLSRAEWLFRDYAAPLGLTNMISVVEAGLVILGFLVAICLIGLSYPFGFSFGAALIGLLVFLYLPWKIFVLLLQNRPFHKILKLISINISNPRIGWRCWTTTLILYIIAWFGFGLAMRFLALGLCITAPIELGTHTILFGIAWLIGFLILFVPSGLGIREQAYVVLLTSNIGIGGDIASLLSVVSRGFIMASEFVWLIIGLTFRNQRKRKKIGDNTP